MKFTAWEIWESGKTRRAEILVQNPDFGNYFILQPGVVNMHDDKITPLNMVWCHGDLAGHPPTADWVKETGSSARIVKGLYKVDFEGQEFMSCRVLAIVFDTAEDLVAFQNEWVA